MKTTRDRLAEIAVSLFAKNGYRETSIGDIEEAAGLTPRAGGFYRHFKSKEAVLVESVRRTSKQLIAEVKLDDILAAGDVRAQLLYIAERVLAHAEEYRTLRLLLIREAHKMPALQRTMSEANARLARQDLAPWTARTLRAAGKTEDVEAYALLIFGPVLTYMISLDRGQPAFGLERERALTTWLDHWAAQLRPRRGAKPPRRRVASKRTRRPH